jgi:hypothetical protein
MHKLSWYNCNIFQCDIKPHQPNILFTKIYTYLSEKIRKMWKKGKLNSEKIWKIWKKPKLNCEMIWKIRNKTKLNSENFGKISYQKQALTVMISPLCTNCHDITVILFNVTLNTINLIFYLQRHIPTYLSIYICMRIIDFIQFLLVIFGNRLLHLYTESYLPLAGK